MIFKKSITFTANVADYSDYTIETAGGTTYTVTARLQAERKVVNDFVDWLRANGAFSSLDRIGVGTDNWAEYPLYNVDENDDIYRTKFSDYYYAMTDCNFCGAYNDGNQLGVTCDNHTLICALTCSMAKALELKQFNIEDSYYNIPSMMLRYHKNFNTACVRDAVSAFYTFTDGLPAVTLNINYWKGANTFVVGNDQNTQKLIFGKTANTPSCAISYGATPLNNHAINGLMHFSFYEDCYANAETMRFTSDLPNTQALVLNYGTSYTPYKWGYLGQKSTLSGTLPYFYAAGLDNYGSVYPALHLMNLQNINSVSSILVQTQYATGLQNNRLIPMTGTSGFPRVNSNELYIRKQYIPCTQIASPIKIGYTPGLITENKVYSINGKYYLALNTGYWSYFVEIAEQEEDEEENTGGILVQG